MKRIALLAVALGALALPGASSAREDCTYTGSQPVRQAVGPVVVYAGGSGTSGAADVSAGACVDGVNTAGFDGGLVEVGAGLDNGNPAGTPGVYGVIDGDDANVDPSPSSQSGGYAALSNFESSPPSDTSCDAAENGTGTNAGGCFFLKPLGIGLPVPLLSCGNTSGKSWEATPRDGCSVP